MSELRKVALDHAVTVATVVRTDRIDATEVVSAAEAFYAFLTSQHPSPVAAGYDLARADQSPVTSILRDADSIPTRLVRRDGTPPDAA